MADITVLSNAVRYLTAGGQYVTFDAIKGDTGPQGPQGPQGDTGEGLAISASITTWTATTWSSGAVAAGETSGGTCYAATIPQNGAAVGQRFVSSLVTGSVSALYVTPQSGGLLVETAIQPSGTVTIQGVLVTQMEVNASRVLLWTNPAYPQSTAADFAGQTVTVGDWSEYDYLVVELLGTYTNGNWSSLIFPTHGNGSMSAEQEWVENTTYYRRIRTVDLIDGSKVRFSDAKQVHPSVSTTNLVLVPIYIYGVTIGGSTA